MGTRASKVGKSSSLPTYLYYAAKPFMSRRVQIALRRTVIGFKGYKFRDLWPIYPHSRTVQGAGPVWPDGKRFALVLTHDVDTKRGEGRCLELVNLEKSLGFKSAFYFVPVISGKAEALFAGIRRNGHEIGVHGLFHDEKLFRSKAIFQRRAALINRFLAKWNASGFRSPCMYHNLSWLHSLDILYDASTFDFDPFEPQPEGAGTIFPFSVTDKTSGKSYVELPYTLPQDHTLFILMKQRDIGLWLKKLDWIAERGGMALVITHPDYMNFGGRRLAVDEYRADLYADFLRHVEHKYRGRYWHALPSEVAIYWKGREAQMCGHLATSARAL